MEDLADLGLSAGAGGSGRPELLREVEPDDTPATAQPLGGTDLVVLGNIYRQSGGTEADVYSFTAGAGDRLYAAVATATATATETETTTPTATVSGSVAGLALWIAAGVFLLRRRKAGRT